jgi:hypothetical protein
VLEVAIDLFADEVAHLAFVAARDGVGIDETFGQSNDADLEAAREGHFVPAAKRDLDAAAADVNHHRGLRRINAVHGRQVNQPRLFGSGNEARANAGLAFDGAQEGAAVLRFAGGAGGDGEHLVDFV